MLCEGVKLKLFGSGYDATEGLGVDQLAGGVALPKLSIPLTAKCDVSGLGR